MIEIKDIGQLDRQITIRISSITVSGNGERINTWATYATRWAAIEYTIEYTGGGESIMDDMAIVDNQVKFTVRYDSNINEKMRINYRSKEYEIRNIQEVGRMDYMVLTCETVTLVDGNSGVPLAVDTTLFTVDSELITADQTLY